MNWYSLFYWITVAERIQTFIFTMAIVSTVITVGAALIYWYYKVTAKIAYHDSDKRNSDIFAKWAARICRVFIPAFFIFWLLAIAIPSKSDTVLIIAGGAVGQFVTSDSSAQKIPADISAFLHEKIGQLTREAKEDLMPSEQTSKMKELENLTKDEILEKLKSDTTLSKIAR